MMMVMLTKIEKTSNENIDVEHGMYLAVSTLKNQILREKNSNENILFEHGMYLKSCHFEEPNPQN